MGYLFDSILITLFLDPAIFTKMYFYFLRQQYPLQLYSSTDRLMADYVADNCTNVVWGRFVRGRFNQTLEHSR